MKDAGMKIQNAGYTVTAKPDTANHVKVLAITGQTVTVFNSVASNLNYTLCQRNSSNLHECFHFHPKEVHQSGSTF